MPGSALTIYESGQRFSDPVGLGVLHHLRLLR